jgi:cytochrome b561
MSGGLYAAGGTGGSPVANRNRGGYSAAMRAMHAGTVALLLASYLAAWALGGAATSAQAARLLMLHRSFGVAILVLTLVRLAWRQCTRVPPLPADLPGVQRRAARAGAVVLYMLLVLQPALGLAGSMLHGDRIVVFGSVPVPNLLATSRPLARQVFQAHGVVALLFLGMACMHAAAAMYHHFIRRDEVLFGMIPGVQTIRRLGRSPPAHAPHASMPH